MILEVQLHLELEEVIQLALSDHYSELDIHLAPSAQYYSELQLVLEVQLHLELEEVIQLAPCAHYFELDVPLAPSSQAYSEIVCIFRSSIVYAISTVSYMFLVH